MEVLALSEYPVNYIFILCFVYLGEWPASLSGSLCTQSEGKLPLVVEHQRHTPKCGDERPLKPTLTLALLSSTRQKIVKRVY